jgi:hypothetical protein
MAIWPSGETIFSITPLCRLTKETWVRKAFDDVASTIISPFRMSCNASNEGSKCV